MTLGTAIHWLGIFLILAVCFKDLAAGEPQNILAFKSYAAIVFGFALTILGINVTREGRKTCLLVLLADWLFEEEPESETESEADGAASDEAAGTAAEKKPNNAGEKAP